MMAVHKVVVTNVSGLKAKYGPEYARLRTSLAKLVRADLKRGLRTRVVAIDSPAVMKRLGGKPVSSVNDQRGAKEAVDAIYGHYQPDYILILGAPDIVPHIDLANPLHGTPDDDGDIVVPSDVPYACAAGWSRQPQDFMGPSRVVGRLPDLAGADEPSYLQRLIDTAARHRPMPRKDYARHFAISAKVWIRSTAESMDNLFGPGAIVLTAPPKGPRWPKRALAPRIHFINCHGDTCSPKFFGEHPTNRFVDAHDAVHLPTRISKGAVVAAECCYGAELYEPAKAQGQAGIANTYLGEGAIGFLGSTTIAYGPSEGQGQADLICQYFIDAVRRGASLGRAALEARQRFVAQFSHTDPADLKTAVQFLLLGDPSVHPVDPTPHAFSRSKTVRQAPKGLVHSETRTFRRERLARTGTNLTRTLGAAVPSKDAIPKPVRRFLIKAAEESGMLNPTFKSYRVTFPSAPQRPRGMNASRGPKRLIFAALGSLGTSTRGARISAIIATVEGDKIVHVRRVHSR